MLTSSMGQHCQCWINKVPNDTQKPMTYKILLIKILPPNHVENFLSGNLYMNTASHFSTFDKTDVVRSDADEGVDEAWQIKEMSVADEKGNWIPIKGIQSPVLYRHNIKRGINIFCMYALPDTSGHVFDNRNLDFGEVGVVITDAKKFVERFRKAALNAGRDAGQGPVEYVEKATHDGAMGPFRKFNSYSYQNEFRFAVDGGDETPLNFPIGDIRDICMVGPSAEINNMIAALKVLTNPS